MEQGNDKVGMNAGKDTQQQSDDEIRRSYNAQFAISTILQLSLEEISLVDILRRALDVILALPWLSSHSRGGIFLADGSKTLVLTASAGFSDRARERCGQVPFGTCLCGRAAAEGKTVFSRQADRCHDNRCSGTDHEHYCTPIFIRGTVGGVITVNLQTGHERDSSEEDFLASLAYALAGIIERKRIEQDRSKLINDLQDAVQALYESKQEWQETFDSIMDLIWIHDEEYRIVKANWAFARYRNSTPREIVNKKCIELFHDARGPAECCPQAVALRENQPVTEEITDPESGRILRITTFPYNFPAGNGKKRGVIHVARDITREREKEMRLIMTERLASLGRLASGVAHEINNPLAAIGGCVDGLARRVNRGAYEPELFRRYLGIIKDELARSKRIATEMLSFVQKKPYERRNLSIHDVLDKTLEIISFQGRLKNVETNKIFAFSLPEINGSEGELRQAFLAVFTNALDAMNDKGAITIATAIEDRNVRIVISDTGPGIPPADINRIFDPFFTTKSESGGSGLGLAIATKIVSAHGGTMRALSEPGGGAAIAITLPVNEQAQ